ncbi:interleukin-1 family member A [Triplophysa rosa]|uniref:Interleukin-1 beta n=1 Tax=Triplophysa rosa TaxID=992332 RepID=A0A9W7TEK0_TRIRA|nr:interleukin-1 family member A [Triplophysa rosa]
MRFSLTMVREEDLEIAGNQEPPHPQFEDVNLLPVSMGDTSFLLDPDDPSHNCDCQYNEMETDSAYSTAVVKLYAERKDLFLKSFLLGKYVCPSIGPSGIQILLEDTMSAKISIYSYIIVPIKKQLGVPVLLNFTATDNFFTCTKQAEKRILTLASCDINKLQCISADDNEKWSLVFLMSKSAGGLYRFESALHSGWFIQIMDSDMVNMQKGYLPGYVKPNTFFSLIESETTETIMRYKKS